MHSVALTDPFKIAQHLKIWGLSYVTWSH